MLRFRFRQQFVLREFGEARKRLRGLEKGQFPGVQDLQRLGDKFNFTNAAAPQFDVALQFFLAHHFLFDPVLDRGDFPEHVGV